MTSQLGQETPVARATARFVRVTPMKARRVVDLIRYLPTDEALALLRFAPQSASEPVAKVVASAVANAEHNLRLDPAALVVSAAYVDEGPTLKRIRPRAQGRAFRIAHMGHVNAPMVFGVLGAIEMALGALGIPHGRGGLQAAVEYLGREVRP